MSIQCIRGVKDILPPEIEIWQTIEHKAKSLLEQFGFKEIRLPLLERTELFHRSIGEETDIVSKEMYTFEDRGGEKITLRPEATASVVRAYLQHNLYTLDPIQKLYTIGPMFRRERPQKGRYRQFYQINAEVFGIDSPLIDAQIIFMLMYFFKNLSLTNVQLHINSLGCRECRPQFYHALNTYLSQFNADDLCEHCNRRRTTNPLRVLDCKVEKCRQAMKDVPSILEFLCPDCVSHFQLVQTTLANQGIDFTINNQLVRGLDYYTRTTFEIQTSHLGAQNAIAGGGRYDGLIQLLGGPDIPAIGFAIGVDRLIELYMQHHESPKPYVDMFIIALDAPSKKMAYTLCCDLCIKGIQVEMDYSARSLKSLMKRADKLNAHFVMIMGEQELANNSVILRNMNTKEQFVLSTNGIVDHLLTQFFITPH
ncbi:MAG: histidine--tRNA ligase [Desulfobacterales bacterium]|nr:histidine--tRNA ligase [Desulfobacterales bacterium]